MIHLALDFCLRALPDFSSSLHSTLVLDFLLSVLCCDTYAQTITCALQLTRICSTEKIGCAEKEN